MVKFAQNVNRNMRWHGNIVAYCILAIGLVAAIWLIQREVEQRAGADNEIREVIKVEVDEESKQRIAALEDLNRKQVLIIRALLKARGINPNLFDGARLPGDTAATAAPRAGDGRAQPRTAAQQPTTGPNPSKPTPKPTVTSPTPRNPVTTPTTPTPTSPTPTTPSPPTSPVIINPPPVTPTPSPVVPPIVDLPVLPIIGEPVICVVRPLLPCLLG